MLCMTVVNSDMRTHVSSSKKFRFSFCKFAFSILCFCFSLGSFIFVLFAFVVLDLVSSVLCQEVGWEERLQTDQFCVRWDVKPELSQSVTKLCRVQTLQKFKVGVNVPLACIG